MFGSHFFLCKLWQLNFCLIQSSSASSTFLSPASFIINFLFQLQNGININTPNSNISNSAVVPAPVSSSVNLSAYPGQQQQKLSGMASSSSYPSSSSTLPYSTSNAYPYHPSSSSAISSSTPSDVIYSNGQVNYGIQTDRQTKKKSRKKSWQNNFSLRLGQRHRSRVFPIFAR